ncbi:MAG: hypothetical protein AB1791_17750 [Chloroflexota bacterium]
MNQLVAARSGSVESVRRGQVVASARLEWTAALLSLALVGGIFLDGWAHNNGRVDDSFFTPWHAVLYSAMLLSGLYLGANLVINRVRGYAWRGGLPAGYLLSLAGVVFFFLAGAGDLVWHNVFGFEVDVEALLSPAHLALGLGAVLLVSGPARVAWGRATESGGRASWPAVLSLFATLSVFTFFTHFAHSYTGVDVVSGMAPDGDPYFYDTTIISYVLIPTTLLMGFILLALRRWRLPAGALALFLAGNAGLMFVLRLGDVKNYWPILPAALVSGLLVEALARTLRPGMERPGALRLFAFLTPFIFHLLYFLTLIATAGIWWRIHLWLGVTVMSGILGLGLSLLLVPPAYPAGE